MEFLHASIALLASMVLILAGMVGWLYYQQTRLFQNMNSIVMVIGELAQPRVALAEYVPEPASEAPPAPQETALEEAHVEPSADKEDDRVSVTNEAEVVDGPPAPLDTDGLEGKSKKDLQDLLTKRGIPFSKSDNKPALINLLKATA